MRPLTVLLVLLIPFAPRAQITFERTYGGADYDRGHSVLQTDDGGYIIAGMTHSFGAGSADVYLIKTSERGDTLWTNTYGGTNDDQGRSVDQTSDGGYIIAGHSYSYGPGGKDVYLIRTDAEGDTLWTRTYGGVHIDEARSVQQTVDGGYILAGSTESFGAGHKDVYLIKTDASGDTVWTRTYGGSERDYGYSVSQTGDGGYIITGCTDSFGAGYDDVYLIKADGAGDTVWTRTYGGPYNDLALSLSQTGDGGYAITGWSDSFGPGGRDAYLIKTDAAGDTVWTRTYGGADLEACCTVEQTGDGGYILAGWTDSFGAGGYDVYLIKTDASGDTIWTRTSGGSSDDSAYWVEQTSDSGFVLTGYAESFGAGASDVYFVKTDAYGLTGVNHPPVLTDQADTTVAVNQYLTFTLEASDPDGDSIWFASSDLPVGASLDSLTGVFVWTPTYAQMGLHTVTFVAADFGIPALADTEQTDITVTDTVGVGDDKDVLRPLAQHLAQNHPNPFGSSTTISYSLRARQPISVAVYDIRGALVRSLVSGEQRAGRHHVVWDGRDQRGSRVGSGIYLCHLEAGEHRETRRMVLLR